MGGAVVSVMEVMNNRSIVPNELIEKLNAFGPINRPVPGTETATSSPIYRYGQKSTDEAYQAVVDQICSGPTCTERFTQTCQTHADAPKIVYRPVVKRVKEMSPAAGKELEVTYLGDAVHIKLGEMLNYVESFGRGLAELGIPERAIICIYEETRWEWLATIYAIWLQNMVASTVYANLGEDALLHALNETKSEAIICNGRSVPALLKSMAAGQMPPSRIIYLDELSQEASDMPVPTGAALHAWNEVMALGQPGGPGAARSVHVPKDHSVEALIMYTSGTTGAPKGVVHTHGSITCGLWAMEMFLDSLLPHGDDERYCAYLPLAHILEFGVVNVFLTRGALVGFGSPRTLTSITARPHGDFEEYKPDTIIAVPRVYDTVRRGVESKLPPKGTFKRNLFDAAFASRLAALKEGKDTPFYNDKIFSTVRAALGGRTRLLLSGGGPISERTQEFVNVAFGFLINGWGLTETVCVGAIQRLGDMEGGCVGQVLQMEELKLVDTEDYKHTDKPEPRGELCLRGPFLFKGYYKQPELTKEAIDSEGWFHTGDVGAISVEGKVRVVSRIKALAKNALGEYIALETLESIYSNHPLVLNNCLAVLVQPARRYICAVAVTDDVKVRAFARAHKIRTSTEDNDASTNSSGSFHSTASRNSEDRGVPIPLPEILAMPEFKKAVHESMSAMCKECRRRPFELPRHVVFVTDEWTVENGVLTAAMKLRRSRLEGRYSALITKLFEEED